MPNAIDCPDFDANVCPVCDCDNCQKKEVREAARVISSELSVGLVAAAVKWLASEEGRREMDESRERIDKTLRWLAEQRTLTFEQLNMPMTL